MSKLNKIIALSLCVLCGVANAPEKRRLDLQTMPDSTEQRAEKTSLSLDKILDELRTGRNFFIRGISDEDLRNLNPDGLKKILSNTKGERQPELTLGMRCGDKAVDAHIRILKLPKHSDLRLQTFIGIFNILYNVKASNAKDVDKKQCCAGIKIDQTVEDTQYKISGEYSYHITTESSMSGLDTMRLDDEAGGGVIIFRGLETLGQKGQEELCTGAIDLAKNIYKFQQQVKADFQSPCVGKPQKRTMEDGPQSPDDSTGHGITTDDLNDVVDKLCEQFSALHI